MPPQRNATRELQEQTILRLVSEQAAIPLDQLARFLGVEHDQIVPVVSRLCKAGCLNQRAVIAGHPDWVWLTYRGAQRSKTGYSPVQDLAVRLLTHLRAINEVRLYVEARAPGGRWLCERAVERELEPNDALPDGVFEIGGERHAIEVELSCKSKSALRMVIASHSNRYDAVVYFCSPQTRGMLEEALEEGAHPKLVVRNVPEMQQILATRSRGFGQPLRNAGHGHKQARLSQSWERHVLALISEQGAIPLDQLARFLDHQAEETMELVEHLCVAKLARRGRLLANESDWVWLPFGGNRLAETGFSAYLPAPGALARLLAMNEVRLHIAARAPQARWIGWRTLRRELSGLGQIPNAVVEVGGERHAIEVELSRKEPRGAARMIDHRSANYDAVVCFCTPEAHRFYKRLAAENYWPKLVIYPLPMPDREATDSAPDEPAPEVDDALWAELEPLLPKDQRSGAGSTTKRNSNRMALNGILYVAHHRIGFRALPRKLGYGSGATCWERLRQWERAGIWADVQQLLEGRLPDGDLFGWLFLAPNPSRSRPAPYPACKRNKAGASLRYEVDDALWAELEPLIPRLPISVCAANLAQRTSDRVVLSALLFILRSGIGWKRLPKELGYGSWSTSYKRVRAWQELEGWDRFVKTLAEKLPDADQLDWSRFHSNPARCRARAKRASTAA